MFLKCTTQPSEEPLSIQEAKNHLRVDDDMTADDVLIRALIAAARQYAESECQRVFVTQSWQLVLDSFPGALLSGQSPGYFNASVLELHRPTVQTIDSIQYLDMGNTWQTMPPTDYVADLNAAPARITPVFGRIWPITLPQIASVKVNFTAGYGAAAAVPEGIKAWIKIRLATLYENREEVAMMNRGKIEPLPYVDRLLDPYRVVSL